VVIILIGGISILVAILLHLVAKDKRPKGFPPGKSQILKCFIFVLYLYFSFFILYDIYILKYELLFRIDVF